MKKLISALLATLAFAALPVLAGKRIQFETVDLTNNKTAPREILLEADRLRVNDGTSSILFLTSGGNRMVILDKSRNEYYVMDQAAMDAMGKQLAGLSAQMEAAMKGMPPEQRAMMEQMMKGKMPAAAAAAVPATSYSAKGAGTVNGFSCTNYDGIRGGQLVSQVCAAQPAQLQIGAQDFQVMTRMREYVSGMLSSLQNSPLAGMMAGGVGEAGVQGFPVRTINYRNGAAVKREELKAVSNATFTNEDFSTGTANQVSMPGSGVANDRGKADGQIRSKTK